MIIHKVGTDTVAPDLHLVVALPFSYHVTVHPGSIKEGTTLASLRHAEKEQKWRQERC